MGKVGEGEMNVEIAKLIRQIDDLGYQTPCDVLLPSNTVIKKGAGLTTLLASIKLRADMPLNYEWKEPRGKK